MLKIVLEKGLTFSFREGHGWELQSARGPQSVGEPEAFGKQYGIRPVLLVADLNSTRQRIHLFPLKTDKSPFELQPSELPQLLFSKASPLFDHVINLLYVIGAPVHHCKNLALLYAEITREYGQSVHLHNEEMPSDPATEQFWAANRPLPYYEFEALITSVRRAYDTMRYLIWHGLGTNKGSTPSSFPDTLKKCIGLPNPLKLRLERSWQEFGQKATDYRDCALHYIPIGGGWPNIKMNRLTGGVWTCSALLPDNPEVRSAKTFTYNLRTDALTYGWELANETTQIAHEIADALPDMRHWMDKIQPD